jgi:hypothetical protein
LYVPGEIERAAPADVPAPIVEFLNGDSRGTLDV